MKKPYIQNPINEISVTGKIVQSPQIRQKKNGNGLFLKFSIVNGGETEQNGEKYYNTQYYNCNVFDDLLISSINTNCKEGDIVTIKGEFKPTLYTSQKTNETCVSNNIIVNSIISESKGFCFMSNYYRKKYQKTDNGQTALPQEKLQGVNQNQLVNNECDDEIPF